MEAVASLAVRGVVPIGKGDSSVVGRLAVLVTTVAFPRDVQRASWSFGGVTTMTPPTGSGGWGTWVEMVTGCLGWNALLLLLLLSSTNKRRRDIVSRAGTGSEPVGCCGVVRDRTFASMGSNVASEGPTEHGVVAEDEDDEDVVEWWGDGRPVESHDSTGTFTEAGDDRVLVRQTR